MPKWTFEKCRREWLKINAKINKRKKQWILRVVMKMRMFQRLFVIFLVLFFLFSFRLFLGSFLFFLSSFSFLFFSSYRCSSFFFSFFFFLHYFSTNYQSVHQVRSKYKTLRNHNIPIWKSEGFSRKVWLRSVRKWKGTRGRRGTRRGPKKWPH